MLRLYSALKVNVSGWAVPDSNGKLPMGLNPRSPIIVCRLKGDFAVVTDSAGRRWTLNVRQIELPNIWLVNFSTKEWVPETDARVLKYLKREIQRMESDAGNYIKELCYFRWMLERVDRE